MIKTIKNTFIHKHIFTSTSSHPCEASFSLFWLIYVHCVSMLNFSKYVEKKYFWMKFAEKIYGWPILWKITHQKPESAYNNMPMYQISVNLENIRFWDQVCPKNMTDKDFEKINIKIVISIQQFTPVRNFSHFVELQITGPNLSKKCEWQKFGKNKH